jgi:hypothetical protein
MIEVAREAFKVQFLALYMPPFIQPSELASSSREPFFRNWRFVLKCRFSSPLIILPADTDKHS